MNTQTQSYAERFDALKGIAAKTGAGLAHTDIDQVIPMLEEALGHNKALLSHLDNIEKLSKEMMNEEDND